MRGTTFYRQARAYPPVLPADEIVISAPPTIQATASGPLSWLQYLLPSVGMLGSLIFIFAYRTSLLFIIGGIAFAVCAIGSGILMGVIQRRTTKQQRKLQRNGYLDYLSRLRKRLFVLAKEQRLVSERLYPTYTKLAERVATRQYLWERRPSDLDFLSVRIGTGPGPLCCRLQLEQDSGQNFLTPFMPDLLTQAEALVHEYRYLDDLPAIISLRN